MLEIGALAEPVGGLQHAENLQLDTLPELPQPRDLLLLADG